MQAQSCFFCVMAPQNIRHSYLLSDRLLVQRYITLPRTAITFNSFGSSIYRVENNGQDEKGKPKFIAKQSLVTTGDTRGDQVAILTGVKEGELIVTSGQIKLHNGSPVNIDNSAQPSNDALPQLDDQ